MRCTESMGSTPRTELAEYFCDTLARLPSLELQARYDAWAGENWTAQRAAEAKEIPLFTWEQLCDIVGAFRDG